jgi:thiamine-phosphate pyrophosphorylase
MSRKIISKGLYVITEHGRLEFSDLFARTETILQAGIVALQYRNKQADSQQKLAEAQQLQALCNQYATLFFINDDIDLALQLKSDGVHIGREDATCAVARAHVGKDMLLGVSCYNDLQRAEVAASCNADYIAFGAMYPTTSKSNTTIATPATIQMAKQRYNLPIIAIGGITTENCLPILQAGADLLAVISSVYLVDDPASVIKNFNQLISDN